MSRSLWSTLGLALALTSIATLAAPCAAAQTVPLQLDLYRVTSAGTEVAATSPIDLGTAAAGDYVDLHMRLRSRETQAVRVTQLYTSGTPAAFSTESYPALPFVMALGSNLDFYLRFSPKDPGTFQGTLFIGFQGTLYVISKTLTAVSPEGVKLQVQQGASFTTLTTAQTVDFGSVERKQSAVRQFALVNGTAKSLTVNLLTILGAGYAIEGLTAPVTVAAGATKTFAVRFAPLQSGILRATLSIDSRNFALEGFAIEPPFPTLSMDAATAARSSQQVTVKIHLSETSRSIGSVKLTLTGLEADTAIALLPAGGRTATLALNEGDTELSTVLQTGTTAGTLKLAADLALQHVETQLVLAAAAPSMATIAVSRVNGRIELRLTGFDNTRATQTAGFLFYDRNGSQIGSTIPTSVADAFTKYFTSSSLGGMFALGASFPVQGDIEAVTGVEVELSNAQGISRSTRVGF